MQHSSQELKIHRPKMSPKFDSNFPTRFILAISSYLIIMIIYCWFITIYLPLPRLGAKVVSQQVCE